MREAPSECPEANVESNVFKIISVNFKQSLSDQPRGIWRHPNKVRLGLGSHHLPSDVSCSQEMNFLCIMPLRVLNNIRCPNGYIFVRVPFFSHLGIRALGAHCDLTFRDL